MAQAQQQHRPYEEQFQEFAEKFCRGANPDEIFRILTATVFKVKKGEEPFTLEEIVAAIKICNRYNLDPWLKEIYPIRHKNALLFVVGVDGWIKVALSQQQCNGMSYEEVYEDGKYVAATGTLWRRDWDHPLVLTEYLNENFRDTDAWRTMPRRMTRNRATCQLVRHAFGIAANMVDADEAEQILEQERAEAVRKDTARARQESVVRQLEGAPAWKPQPWEAPAQPERAERQAPATKPKEAEAPPAAEAVVNEDAEPPEVDEEANRKLMYEFAEMRQFLDAKDLLRMKRDSGCDLIHPNQPTERLERAIIVGREIVAAKKGGAK